MSDPLEDLRTQLHRAEKFIADLQEQHPPPKSDDDHASLHQLRRGRRNLRDLNENFEEEIANIVEREQRRIARDLHDSLGSLLTAIDLRISTLREDIKAGQLPEMESIDLVAGLCREAITRSRTLTRGLFPVGEDPEDLGRALADLAENSNDRFPLQCRFECPATIAIHDPEVANQLYRIAQEATANAAKHSGGQAALIRLESRADDLTLSIEDDGSGIDSAGSAREDSRGLRIMEYRAAMIDAELDVATGPGRGTRITCRLPLSRLGNPPGV